jgi:hypothetical protein
VHHRTLEAELCHCSLELIGRRLRIRRRQRGEAREPAAGFVYGLLQPVIRRPGYAGRGLGVEALRRRRGVRQHLEVDPGLVHLLDAQLAHIQQPLAQRRRARLRPAFLEMLADFGVEVMLFEGDDFHSFLTK